MSVEGGPGTLAVLGAGTMGAAMSRNLAAAGMAVRVWNRTPERARDAARAEGIEATGTPAEAARGADAVITMLSDVAAVEESMTGSGGALSELEDAPWVQMSTIGLAGTVRLRATAEEQGVTFVDAPVLGTREPAEQGELLVLASGPEEVRERLAPLFDAIGRETRWLGEAGAGTRLKLVLNAWLLTLVEGTAEAIALARAVGVDPEDFLSGIEGGPLGTPYAELKGRAMIEGRWEPSFALSLARKDAELVLDAAADLELPFATAVTERLRAAEEAGHGEEDVAALYRVSTIGGGGGS